MSKYTDLALRLEQIDAQIKTSHSHGATAVRKQRQAEVKIVEFRTKLEHAQEEAQLLALKVADLKKQRKQILEELRTRTEQTV